MFTIVKRGVLRTTALWAVLSWVVAGLPAKGAAPDIWPAQSAQLADRSLLKQHIDGLEAAASTVPPNLMPAIRFQEAFVRALVGDPESNWLPEMQSLASTQETDAMTSALRDVAKAWIARVEMREIGKTLDTYYVQNVRYPDSFSAIERDLPASLKLDPWGEAWVYRLHAPVGFSRQTLQRYSLGPKRYPDLGTLEEATVNRPRFVAPAWKIAPRAAGEAGALEFSSGGSVVAVLQAGGKIDDYTVVYIASRWVLMASRDQLFAEAF
jgi:hypothetical protein